MKTNNFAQKSKKLFFKKIALELLVLSFFAGLLLSLPHIFSFIVKNKSIEDLGEFPVTVNPKLKKITEDEKVNSYLEKHHDLLANAGGAKETFWSILQKISSAISEMPILSNLSAVGSERFVALKPGLRKEQVAEIFAKKLGWGIVEKNEFLSQNASSSLAYLNIKDGYFFPDTYVVSRNANPNEVKKLLEDNFQEEVLTHYPTTTAEIVPIKDALTIASIIQKETISNDGMRLISGILWNRLFANMKLQIDATLQYAEANSKKNGTWWPSVEPNDKYIKSPYNTYIYEGLPPGPIASPSVAAILAALNPIETSCLYYFNDKQGKFHCSESYKEHKELLKKYYGN